MATGTLYVPRKSSLHDLNPLTKITVSLALVLLAFFGPGYWMSAGLYVLVLLPMAVAARVIREYVRTSVRLFLPLFGFIFVMQSIFHPGGTQVLLRLGVLTVRAESVQFAFLTAARLLVMASSFLLLLMTTHPSLLMNDLSRRGLPGTVAYIVTSTLQIVPLIGERANSIIAAQRSRGLETQGSFAKRARALVPLIGPLVFGSVVEVEERAIAIEARGFSAKTAKTSLIEVSERPSEVRLRWGLVILLALVLSFPLWRSLILKA
mgnify:CR=1 FL=1|jgi:energy-coupling factor transport system permease protein